VVRRLCQYAFGVRTVSGRWVVYCCGLLL